MNDNNLNLDKYKKKRLRSLYLIVITGAFEGLVTAFSKIQNDLNALSFFCALLLTAWIYSWIYYDAIVLNYRIATMVKYLVILAGFIGVPLYFWRSRTTKDFWFNFGGLWLFFSYFIANDVFYRIAQLINQF